MSHTAVRRKSCLSTAGLPARGGRSSQCTGLYGKTVAAEGNGMMRCVATTAVLVGLVVLGISTRRASAGPPLEEPVCFVCRCLDGDATATACSPVENPCPACPAGEVQQLVVFKGLCGERPDCLALLAQPAPAPALSGVPLVGVGVSLLCGGIWLTRKRQPFTS